MNKLYENEFLQIEMINPNYPFLKMKKNGAVIVPYDKEGNVYLLKKYRPNIGEFYELPRGFVENEESFSVGAMRELMEETGMEAIKVNELGIIQPDTGVLANKVKMYAILVEQKDNYYEHFDESDKELSKVYRVSADDITQLIYEGKIVCAYTLGSIFVYNNKKKSL